MRRVVLKSGEAFTADQLNRSGACSAEALKAALSIIEDVQRRGDAALRDYSERFDGVALKQFRVPDEQIEAAASKVDSQLSKALVRAAAQIREFHERQREQSWFAVREDGALTGVKVEPLDSVGIYVPGGRALYPSTVLMNALPALVAGVPRIVCTTPPTASGELDPAILGACRICGVTEIYAVGGAQAVAALAYGTESIAPVAKITGPGNAYVAAAKKLVSGDVGIDMIAGPSEVCVIADETARPELVAIDLMAQAEHDPLASCYLVTFSEDYADAVEAAIDRLMSRTTRAEITRASLDDQGLIVICPDRESAFDAANVIAPEHLEVHMEDALDYLGLIRNAGAIFLGSWTPEAVGDYVAGPNHTLPTGGTARYASPLSVEDYVKKSSVLRYTAEALRNDAQTVTTIADHEGLWAHARSVEMRLSLWDGDAGRGGGASLSSGASGGAAPGSAAQGDAPRSIPQDGGSRA